MNTYISCENIPTQPRSVALGLFDRLHPAHRRVILSATMGIEDGTAVSVYTFEPTTIHTKTIDGLLYRNNKVVKNTDYKPFHWNKDQFLLQRVNNVEIEDLFFYRGGNIIKEVKLNK